MKSYDLDTSLAASQTAVVLNRFRNRGAYRRSGCSVLFFRIKAHGVDGG
jgi:hypothetical protein